MIKKTKFRTLLIFSLFVLILSILIGCAAKKPFWGNPKTGLILMYKLSPEQVWKYSTTTDLNQTMEMMNQSMESSVNTLMNYSIKQIGIDTAGNYITRITIDTLSTKLKSPRGEKSFDFSSLIGKSVKFVVSPKGEQIELSNPDSVKIDLGPMAGGVRDAKTFFQNILPELPPNPIKIGESWTSEKSKKEPRSGMEININSKTTSTLKGFENINGMDCLKIVSQTTGTLEGSGEQMGRQMDIEGDIDGSSTWYFAYKKGIFVKMSSEQSIESTITVSGQANMTIPMTQEIKIEIKLLH